MLRNVNINKLYNHFIYLISIKGNQRYIIDSILLFYNSIIVLLLNMIKKNLYQLVFI